MSANTQSNIAEQHELGILLINSGTPDAPEEEAIRIWLEQMLTDPVLIGCPMAIWRRVLDYVILPRRPQKTAPRYQKFWTEQGSPFLLESENQAKALQEHLCEESVDVQVELAMRYGNPSIESKLIKFQTAACKKIVVVPMYPQECVSCTGTILPEFDRVFAGLADASWNPEIIKIQNYYENPRYLDAIVQSIQNIWTPTGQSRLAISFHSEPVKFVEDGDPYQEQINYTAEFVASKLGLSNDQWLVTYQSRFDNRKWLNPFLEATLDSWAQEGITDVCVVCPGFSVDCLETTIEVGQELRDLYLSKAKEGAKFTYVPALGADPLLIAALADEILKRI